jgi:hypothetical protein
MGDRNTNLLSKAAFYEAPQPRAVVERNSLAALLFPSIMSTGPRSSRPPLSPNGPDHRGWSDLARILEDVLDLLDDDDVFDDSFPTPASCS